VVLNSETKVEALSPQSDVNSSVLVMSVPADLSFQAV
jgi:hypothetical protein